VRGDDEDGGNEASTVLSSSVGVIQMVKGHPPPHIYITDLTTAAPITAGKKGVGDEAISF